jgi:hypothetical protein
MSRPKSGLDTSRPPSQSFSWFLILTGLPFLGLGGWGVYHGYVTLKWPRATAIILDANLRVHDADASRHKTVTHTVDIRYEYRRFLGSAGLVDRRLDAGNVRGTT